MAQAFLIKPKFSKKERFLAYLFDAGLTTNNDTKDILAPRHKLFVPGQFILGDYKKISDDFKLLVMIWTENDKIRYEDNQKGLDRYQKAVNEGKVEVVKTLDISQGDLESMAELARSHVESRERFFETGDKLISLTLERYNGGSNP